MQGWPIIGQPCFVGLWMIDNKTMVKEFIEKKERKVEYIELIYDLIFVYIIGRNNLLLHHTPGGFVSREAFISYIFCTLAVI